MFDKLFLCLWRLFVDLNDQAAFLGSGFSASKGRKILRYPCQNRVQFLRNGVNKLKKKNP